MENKFVKLVVSDFDGTLLACEEEAVSEEICRALDTLTGKGIVFAVSSGRTYSELLNFLPQYKNIIYYICCDGAYTVKNGKTLYARQIGLSDIEPFFKYAKATKNFSFVLHGACNNYFFGANNEPKPDLNAEFVNGIYEIKEKIFKITTYGSAITLPDNTALRMHWDGNDCETAQYVNRFCNKGVALSDLQSRLMLSKFDTVCMGDGGNDVAMMKNAKLKLCVGKKCKELYESCDICVDCGKDGIEKILNLVL